MARSTLLREDKDTFSVYTPDGKVMTYDKNFSNPEIADLYNALSAQRDVETAGVAEATKTAPTMPPPAPRPETLAGRIQPATQPTEEWKPFSAGPVAARPITEKEKPAVEPVSPSGGMDTTKPSPPVEPTDTKKEKQGQKKDSLQTTLDEITRIQAAFGANKEPSRKELKDLLNQLESVKPDTETYRDPVVRNFVQDRAEAFRAYKEKADRNEWLELAQNLANSLTQYASAQAASGTRFTGGVPVASIDYGAKTDRAMKEYQMQEAGIAAEQRAAETEQERIDRLRREDVAARRSTLGERITAERERIRQEEADAKQAGRDAVSLYSTLQANKRAVEANSANLEKALLQYSSRQDKVTEKQLDNQIGFLSAEETRLKRQLDAANELMEADKKNYGAKLANWASAAGQNVDNVVKKAEDESGFFTSKQDYIQETLAPQHANMLQEQLATITRQLDQLKAAKYSGGAQPQPQPQPVSTPAAKPGTVILRNPKTGRTKETVWDKTAQDLVQSGQLELVR